MRNYSTRCVRLCFLVFQHISGFYLAGCSACALHLLACSPYHIYTVVHATCVHLYLLLVSEKAKRIWIPRLFSLKSRYLASTVVGYSALCHCERPAQRVYSCIYKYSIYVIYEVWRSTYSAARKRPKSQKWRRQTSMLASMHFLREYSMTMLIGLTFRFFRYLGLSGCGNN